MQFVVPQFIEREPKIVGPFTFRQFVFIGTAGAISFALYFYLPFSYFILITIVLMLGALALALVRIGGRSLPTILKNFFFFFISPKIYLWGRKAALSKLIIKEKEEPKKEEKETPALTLVEKSHLKKLATKIETMLR